MNALNDLCSAQRPVYAIIQRLNREFLRLRDIIGESLGLDSPNKVHVRSGKSVLWDGTNSSLFLLRNCSRLQILLTLPTVTNTWVDTQELQEMFDNFNEDVDNNFTYLYGSGSASETLTNIDDYMILYLYSHYCSRSSGSSSGRSGRGGCSGDSRGGDCHDR